MKTTITNFLALAETEKRMLQELIIINDDSLNEFDSQPFFDQNFNIQSNWINNTTAKQATFWKAIGRCTDLRILVLEHCEFNTLPETFFTLTKLTSLSLRNNGLYCLPDYFHKLPNLEILNLSHNHLIEIPKTIGCLTKLSTLDLSHNQLLYRIPESMSHLKNLQNLYIDHNPLAEFPILPKTIRQLPTLNNPLLRSIHNPRHPLTKFLENPTPCTSLLHIMEQHIQQEIQWMQAALHMVLELGKNFIIHLALENKKNRHAFLPFLIEYKKKLSAKYLQHIYNEMATLHEFLEYTPSLQPWLLDFQERGPRLYEVTEQYLQSFISNKIQQIVPKHIKLAAIPMIFSKLSTRKTAISDISPEAQSLLEQFEISLTPSTNHEEPSVSTSTRASARAH